MRAFLRQTMDKNKTTTLTISSILIFLAILIINPREENIKNQSKKTILKVPFTVQAPYGNWSAPYDEACEEASIIMVLSYLKNETLTQIQADNKILNLIEWEGGNNFSQDLDMNQLSKLVLKKFNLESTIYYNEEVNIQQIKSILDSGKPIIVPADGIQLENPHFAQYGPLYHMLVIIGYDDKNFITNDPGTKFGQSYPYEQQLLMKAVHNWNGKKETLDLGEKAMITIRN